MTKGDVSSCNDNSNLNYCYQESAMGDDFSKYTTYPGLNKGIYSEYPCSISRECILNNWARNMIFVEAALNNIIYFFHVLIKKKNIIYNIVIYSILKKLL